jgi:hypothetical protein
MSKIQVSSYITAATLANSEKGVLACSWNSSTKTGGAVGCGACGRESRPAGAEELRRRNAELEREVAPLRAELEAARLSTEAAEETEKWLCAQVGEAIELARELAETDVLQCAVSGQPSRQHCCSNNNHFFQCKSH